MLYGELEYSLSQNTGQGWIIVCLVILRNLSKLTTLITELHRLGFVILKNLVHYLDRLSILCTSCDWQEELLEHNLTV